MSITAIFEIRLNPSTLSEAADVIANAVRDTRAFPGCQSVEVLQATDDAQRIIVLERWESAEHDAAYRQWRAGEGTIAKLPGLLAAPPHLVRAVPWEAAT
jgi:quinol monooxygenase YgiN